MLRTERWAALGLVAFAACHPPRPAPSPTSEMGGVTVSEDPPPASARRLGEIDGEDGSGCGFMGQKGSSEGARASVRDHTAALGGDYAEIVKVIPPVHTMDCLANQWLVHAVAYRLAERAAPVAPVAAPSAPIAPASGECTPPCSPGYACSAGVCLALCNPACGPGTVCRQDRICVPAP
jgi:hypothetical protein